MLIQVLGTGCAKCNELEKLVKARVAEAGIEATVEKITDIQKIASMTSPIHRTAHRPSARWAVSRSWMRSSVVS